MSETEASGQDMQADGQAPVGEVTATVPDAQGVSTEASEAGETSGEVAA